MKSDKLGNDGDVVHEESCTHEVKKGEGCGDELRGSQIQETTNNCEESSVLVESVNSVKSEVGPSVSCAFPPLLYRVKQEATELETNKSLDSCDGTQFGECKDNLKKEVEQSAQSSKENQYKLQEVYCEKDKTTEIGHSSNVLTRDKDDVSVLNNDYRDEQSVISSEKFIDIVGEDSGDEFSGNYQQTCTEESGSPRISQDDVFDFDHSSVADNTSQTGASCESNASDTENSQDASESSERPREQSYSVENCNKRDSLENKGKQSKSPSLSVEEYKRKHNIGSRASTENVTYKESAFLASSPDLFSPHSSPCKSPTKTVTPEKQKLYDSGIDMEYSTSCGKTAVVHMGERVSIEGHTIKVKEKSANKSKMSRKRKLSESIPMPSRRLKREASLNASAMVNILFEKEKPLPKSPTKKKSSEEKNKWPDFKVDKESKCGKKTENVEVPKDKNSVGKSGKISEVKKSKEEKVKDLTTSNKRKLLSIKAIIKRNKELKKIKREKSKAEKKTLLKQKRDLKAKKEKDIKSKRRKSSEKSSDDKVKVRKPRTDTRKAARTHAQVTPKKRRLSGSKCASCLQPLSGQQKSSPYWTNQSVEGNNSKLNQDSEEPKSHVESQNLSNISHYNISRMQQMEGTIPMMPHLDSSLPRVQQLDGGAYVLPHSHIPNVSYCHQCAPHASAIMTAPCQGYSLGASMTMMPYQTFGGGYPLSYQTTPPSLSHCGKSEWS